ncbi:hypothetical protein llap_13193 [Limosa lapponica baueri]|uniref:Uncharacterized protein n=1 Tax=Limosa lapponica baueri TaxID=1758121 RepID=A0A2I0TRZ0_LIMLA|nr:hypothetical protein llap_13193 [Limosa lapponica baueri]
MSTQGRDSPALVGSQASSQQQAAKPPAERASSAETITSKCPARARERGVSSETEKKRSAGEQWLLEMFFYLQLDKVDETIIFVIGRSSRNVMAEDFCRWKASAVVQVNGKICLGMLGFPPSFVSPEDRQRIPTSLASPVSLRQEVISRERDLWSSR